MTGAQNLSGRPKKVDLGAALAAIPLDRTSHLTPLVQKAVGLARWLQRRGAELQAPQERRQQAELERMMHSPHDKATLLQLTDQTFRAASMRRSAEQLTHLLDVQGIPRFFSVLDRALLRGFQSFGSYLPGVSMPLVKEKMRAETANVILPAEPALLLPHLAQRRAQGLRMNVNYLGEALLGERAAERRLEDYLRALEQPEIECISVKISTLYSQIQPLAHEASVQACADRLETLYRAAARARFERDDGTLVPKLVYLDMEEYRDLRITLDAFMCALDRPGAERAQAGIALQAYLPDSHAAQCRLNSWARKRAAKGGAPVTLRIVKGANLEAEKVEASLHGWPQAVYRSKRETDANYKRMLHEGLDPDTIAAVHLGIASHNLFELAYALVLAHESGVLAHVQLEMLEGMANHQRRALSEVHDNVLLYAPATRKSAFTNAIGYLIRRLDENTGPDNFLRHAFKLEVGSEDWRALEQDFISSFDLLGTLDDDPRRTQDRLKRIPLAVAKPRTLAQFVNERDTDWVLPKNRQWAGELIRRWKGYVGDRAVDIPLHVAGNDVLDARPTEPCRDPSRPGVVVGRYRMATEDDVDRAIACARSDPTGWRSMESSERSLVLARVAEELRRARADLMGAALANGGKLLTESDAEVSEAIDFVEYYAAAARELHDLSTVEARPKGVVAVISPWNFPIAIPCGGVAAALAAGNTVLLKPASHTVLVAHELCQCFWHAGVPKEVLQLLPAKGASGGARLVASTDVDAVVFTGSTETALGMLRARPQLALLAETGGKNATIVTAMSDRDLAIKHVLHSAFSHSGQRCSATSLLILEAEVYDDRHFKETLCDAVQSLKVGSAWDLDTRVGPLIVEPSGALAGALDELEANESWAVVPLRSEQNANLVGPCVKWGVKGDSSTYRHELFGPLLAVMRAGDLHEAIELANGTGYGLTAGLESLDDREQALWRERIRAGNLYINRVTTGAIVQRQPFGGLGKSAFGPGIKAGGPNYVAQLMHFSERTSDRAIEGRRRGLRADLDSLCEILERRLERETDDALTIEETARLLKAIASYDSAFASEFGIEHDDLKLVGQDNLRRYRPIQALRLRVHRDDTAFEIFARVCAARTVGCHITVSSPPRFDDAALDLLDTLTASWAGALEIVEETDADLERVIAGRQTDRVRYAHPSRVPERILRAAAEVSVYIASAPVLAEGRIELLWYVYEQSISFDYHRYGNLGNRAEETRKPVD